MNKSQYNHAVFKYHFTISKEFFMEAEKTSSTESYIALTDIYICVWLKTAFHNIFKGDNRARRSELSKVEISGIQFVYSRAWDTF